MYTLIQRKIIALFCACMMVVTPTMVGCNSNVGGAGGTGGAGGSGTVTHASESDFDQERGLSTDSTGKVRIESAQIDRPVEVEVTDEAGNPIQGVNVVFAARDGAFGIIVTDPSGTYGDALVLGNPDLIQQSMPNAKAVVAEKPFAIVAAVIIVVKVVLFVGAAITAFELGQHLGEIIDFGIQNFESISLSTTTFRARFGDVVDLMESTLLAGVAAISLATPIKQPGARAWSRTVLKWEGKELTKKVATNLTKYLIKEGADLAHRNINEDTEVLLKVHHWGSLFPPYRYGIEILIPADGDTVDTLLEEETVTLGGRWNAENGASVLLAQSADFSDVVPNTVTLDNEGGLVSMQLSLSEAEYRQRVANNSPGSTLDIHQYNTSFSAGEQRIWIDATSEGTNVQVYLTADAEVTFDSITRGLTWHDLTTLEIVATAPGESQVEIELSLDFVAGGYLSESTNTISWNENAHGSIRIVADNETETEELTPDFWPELTWTRVR